MPPQSPNEKALLAENAELRARLEEAEETLRAIRCGEVDALVVESSTGPHVYSLQSADAVSNRFRGEILTQINDVVIAIDLEQRITYFNAAAERQYCVHAVDVLGRKIDEVYTKHWPSAETEAAVWAALRERGEWRGEAVHRTFDDRELSVEASVSVLRNNDGVNIGLLAVIRDITERKHNEKLLAESQQKYAGILTSAIDAIVTVDSNHNIITFNPAAELMFGCTANEAIGGSLARFIPEKFRHAHDIHITAFGHTANSSRKMGGVGMVTGLRTNGEEFPIEMSISQSGTEGAKLFTAILRDITERVHAETVLKDQLRLKDQLAKVAELVPGLICSFRLHPDGSSHMPYASPAVESIFGLSAETLAEDFSPVFARIHPDDIGNVNATTAESARTLVPWLGAFRYRHPIKGEIWLESHSIPQQEADGGILWQGYVQDITHRKLAEKALQQRENELGLIMDAAPVLISYLDTDFRYLRVNKTYENWFCIPREDILGHEAREIIGEKAWGIVSPYLERARLGERVSFDYQIPYGTGKPRWVYGNYIPDKDANGNVKGIVVHVTDIEDRKRAELERQKSEEFVRGVLNSLPEYVVVLDDSGVITAVNESWKQFAIENNSTSCNVSVGANYLEVCRNSLALGDPYAQTALNGLEALFAGHQQEFLMEYPCQTPSDKLWFIMYAKRISLSDRKGIILSHVDITKRKRAEDELVNAQARLALIIDEVNAGYWDWDLNTNALYLSPEWNRQLGLDNDKMLLKWDRNNDRLHPDDRARVMAETEHFLAGRHSKFELQFRLRHKDGSYRWIHSHGALLRDEHGQPYRMLGLNLDITDYKREMEMNARRNEMEKSFQLYVATQTAAAIAHELNQPLTAIAYYAFVVQNKLKTGDHDLQKLASIMEKCGEQAQRAGDVIHQLLALLHKGETASEPVDINRSVHDAVDFLKTHGHFNGFKVGLDLGDELPLITANTLQVQKVLINLLNNGVESMKECGKSTGIVTVTTCFSSKDPSMAEVTVSDSGKGVPDTESLNKMFQPFYSTKENGLGMGLAICRALIEAHGGRMWAEQNPGMGLSVKFTLPFV